MSKLKLFGQNILIVLMTLIVAVSVATVAMIGVYSISSSSVKENVVDSLQVYKNEGDWPKWAPHYFSSQLDNCTDALMLASALYSSLNESRTLENIVQEAMLNPRYGHRTTFKSAEALIEYFESPNSPKIRKTEYFGYWHGYLVFLKPLLMIFNVDDIRMLNVVLQSFLLSLLIIKLYSIGKYRLVLPFLAGIMIINPVSCALCIQYSDSYCVMLLSCWIMLQYKLYDSSRYWYFFLLCGICLAFIDVLVYPLIILGIPLILFIVLNNDEFLLKMKKVIIASICWLIGYAGMWSGKWITATLLTEANIFAEVCRKIKYRLGGGIPGRSDIDVISSKSVSVNLEIFYRNEYILICGIILLLVISFILYHQKYKFKLKKSLIIPLLWVALYPVIWCAIIRNHSILHAWFVFKLFSVTTLALIYAIVYSFEKVCPQNEDIQKKLKSTKRRKKKYS